MKINKIQSTCSMVELGSLDLYDIKGISRKSFRRLINSMLKNLNMSDTHDKNYSILYNCSYQDLVKHLKKLGFKHVYTYDGHRNPVKVFILQFDKRNWFQRLFNLQKF